MRHPTDLPADANPSFTKTLEAAKEEFTTGSTFAGRYQIIEELGKGGMGKVSKVLDKEVNAKVALFTACLGLFGLASFLAEKRTKEMGIRKVLGAPVFGLVLLQTREFSKWILFSGLAAGLFAFFSAARWLRGFAYHVNPGVNLFLAAIIATWLVALLAVIFQSFRAALVNPAGSLRHE